MLLSDLINVLYIFVFISHLLSLVFPFPSYFPPLSFSNSFFSLFPNLSSLSLFPYFPSLNYTLTIHRHDSLTFSSYPNIFLSLILVLVQILSSLSLSLSCLSVFPSRLLSTVINGLPLPDRLPINQFQWPSNFKFFPRM